MTPTMARDTVAILGAGGPMGFPVARSVALARIPLQVWDAVPGEAGPLASHGAHVAETPAGAADGAGIVLTMLDDPAELLEVMGEEVIPVIRGRDEHAIWLQMARVGEDVTRECIRLASRNGVGIVDAPLHGLTMVESGPEETRPRVQPVFDAIGHRIPRAGEARAATFRLLPLRRVAGVAGCCLLAVRRGTARDRWCISGRWGCARWWSRRSGWRPSCCAA
jgi:3-hydroxyisobutyrate dehydrogenase